MLTEPADLDRAEIGAALERHWGLKGVRLDYLPVGFGSHHWSAVDSRGDRWFATVDDLRAENQPSLDPDSNFDVLERAFATAAVLRDRARLEFVLAPLPDGQGSVVRRLGERYALTLSPFLEGETKPFGVYESKEERRLMAGVLGRLHAATRQVPGDLPRREDFSITSKASLVEALDDLDRPWNFGPFAGPTRRLLRSSSEDIHRRLDEYDRLVTAVRDGPTPWVITHGEPHRANVIRNRARGVLLVDWDTTMIAPRERDLRHVLDEERTGWDEYLSFGAFAGPVALNEQAMELYRHWWNLTDIAIYVAAFRRPHTVTEDAAASWQHLTGYLQGAP